jgi:hypothetical protein
LSEPPVVITMIATMMAAGTNAPSANRAGVGSGERVRCGF